MTYVPDPEPARVLHNWLADHGLLAPVSQTFHHRENLPENLTLSAPGSELVIAAVHALPTARILVQRFDGTDAEVSKARNEWLKGLG